MELYPEASGLAAVEPLAYLAIVEAGPDGYSAYVPDLPGCVAAADTRDEVIQLLREAIPLHLEAMQQNGDPIPSPTTTAVTIDVAANVLTQGVVKQPPTPEEWLTMTQVAEALGMHRTAVYKTVRQGRLPARRIGSTWLVRRCDLKTYRAATRHARGRPRGARG